MAFPELVKAALELGVVPALALFLVFGMFLQNRQLSKERHDMEKQLLSTLAQVLSDSQKIAAIASQPRLPSVGGQP